MLNKLLAFLPSLAVLAAITALAFLCIWRLMKKKDKCGCGCEGCAMKDSCSKENKNL